MKSKKEILGQYFTKVEIVHNLLNLFLSYKKCEKNIKILEPALGTGNFIKILREKKFSNVDGCEIDADLAPEPSDFFEMPTTQKYDLVIGNPPFSKYNLEESYFNIKEHLSFSPPT